MSSNRHDCKPGSWQPVHIASSCSEIPLKSCFHLYSISIFSFFTQSKVWDEVDSSLLPATLITWANMSILCWDIIFCILANHQHAGRKMRLINLIRKDLRWQRTAGFLSSLLAVALTALSLLLQVVEAVRAPHRSCGFLYRKGVYFSNN